MGLNKRLIGAGAVGSGALTPSENFKVVLYTGNGGTQAITGVGFKPDWVWIKDRGADGYHAVHDSTRGATKGVFTNVTTAEYTGLVTSLDTDGFTVNHTKDGSDNNTTNRNGGNFVAWCWKANGGTTASGSGTNTTSVTNQVNAAGGFSITTFTGSASAAGNFTHGLGEVPDMYIVKTTSFSDSWFVWHKDLTNTTGYAVRLNTNAAEQNLTGFWNDTAPTSTLISLGNGVLVNNATYVAYAFKSIDGFSKFGSYTGNGDANGPIVETGFEPAFLMIKNITSSGQDWRILDNKRNASNPRNCYLSANNANAEECQYAQVDFLSNGFQVIGTDGSLNQNSSTMIFMAFAADPDTEAPTLADSFAVKTYTGNGGTQSITGLGFGPSLAWIKSRSNATSHELNDVVRGQVSRISTDTNAAASSVANGFVSLDNDGFSLDGTGSGGEVNHSGRTYVAWNWKADDNESTIEEVIADVDAKAIYTLESNANDVTGNYNATASGITYSSGKFGNAATYSGTNASSGSKIYVSNNIYGSSTSTFTVSLWIKCTNTSGEIPISGNGGTIGGTTGYAIYLNSGKLALTFRTNPNQNFYADTTSINDDAWHHIALTCNEGDFVLYLDNSVNASGTTSNWSGNPTPTYDTYFGNRWNRNESGVLAGQIDQIRIYDSPLTAASITNLYNETQAQNSTLDIGTQAIVSIQSIVSANANAGFSIVKYEGTGTAGTKIPHGLSSAPDMVINKRLDSSADWNVFHSSLTTNYMMKLNASNAAFDGSAGTNGGAFTVNATNLTVVGGSSTSNNNNASGGEYIAYCFHDVAGYSKIGTYTGNGSASGTVVEPGFSPDFVLVKRTDGTSNWGLFDSQRGGSYYQKGLLANTSNGEYAETNVNSACEFLAAGHGDAPNGGFRFRDSGSPYNVSSGTYIYMAIKINLTPAVDTGKMAFLVVAGGASGSSNGGGGGAGGLRTSFGTSSGGGSSAESVHTLSSGTYTITIGAGGAAQTTYQDRGLAGSTSSISGNLSVSTVGGGGGGSNNTPDGIAGGSGGGAGTTPSGGGHTGGAGTSNEGFAGGNTTVNGHPYVGAGGGGASAAAANVSSTPGVGGAGLAVNINNDSQAYAGGGGGTGGTQGATGGAGGTGGGGQGGTGSSGQDGYAATVNTGGGGGASGDGGDSGAGGSGIVILRMRTSDYSGTTTGSPTVTTVGEETMLKYTGSGTYVHS